MPNTRQIRGLTPLRGIAAFIVIVFHYQLFIALILPAGTTHIFDKLYLMVDLFFVLSGFIMYHVYGETFREGISQNNFWPFMKARFARIYPLHLVTFLYLLGVYAFVTFTNTPISWWDEFLDTTAILPQFLLIQAMGTHHEATWNTPTWSISVEWWAYVVFPLVMLALFRSGRWSRWLLAVLIVGGYLWIMYDLQPAFWQKRFENFGVTDAVYPVGTIDVITGPAFLRCLCGFFLGMLCFEIYQNERVRSMLKSGWIFLACWVVLFVCWHFDALLDVVAAFIFGLMILSAACCEGKVSQMLNGKWLTFLGDISYSMYLVHMPLVLTFILGRKYLFQPDPREIEMSLGYSFSLPEAWFGLALLLVLTIGISALTYRYIEKPARRMIKNAGSGVKEGAVAPQL